MQNVKAEDYATPEKYLDGALVVRILKLACKPWFGFVCVQQTTCPTYLPATNLGCMLQELNSTSGSWFDRASLATQGYDEPNVGGFGEPDVTEVANHA